MKFSRFNVVINDIDNQRILLNNSLSGSTFVVDEKIAKIVENKEIDKLSDEEINILKMYGIILEDEIYDLELKNIEYFHNKEKYNNDTLNLTILLTMNCNLRCIYCYEAAGVISKESITLENYEMIFKFIKNELKICNSRSLSICLFGGEPTIELKKAKTFLDKIRKYCDENEINFFTSIVTNGTLIDKEVIDILLENNCQFEQITLDGTKDFHDTRRITADGKGSYDKTIDGIKKLIESDLPNPVIRINIDKTNYKNVFDLLEELAKDNLNCCSIDFGIVKSNTPSCEKYDSNCLRDEEIPEVLKILWKKTEELGFSIYNFPVQKFTYCGMYSDSAFTINPNLDLYKCWDLVNQNKHKIGKINEEGVIIDITESYFNWMNRNPLNINECVECKYLPACGGGCAAMAKINDNKYNQPGCYKMKGVYELEVLNRFKENAINEN